MILVIGSRASGKRAYVRSLGYGDADMAEAVLDERPVLCGLETLLRQDVPEADVLLQRLLEKRVVMCDEVGAGVIPLDPAERAWREAVGRLCIRLAERAERVVRCVCGVPMVIKGD